MTVSADIEFYQTMFLIRFFEQRILQLFSEGKIFGTTHTYIGQEANAVGLLTDFTPEDVVFSNHRCHGHYLAYSDDVDGLMAELMGRTMGVCGGKGGSQHLCNGNFYTNGVQGGIVPCAVGIALAEKLKKRDPKVAVFLGDGTLGEGVVYESFNIASLWAVPLLFVVENNAYAQSTPAHLQIAGDISARAEAFGIKTERYRPDDVSEIEEIGRKAWHYIQETHKPFCLILDTYRFSPHSKGDDFRSAEEINHWQDRDPLGKLAARLEPTTRIRIEQETKDRVESAIERASAAEQPDASAITWG